MADTVVNINGELYLRIGNEEPYTYKKVAMYIPANQITNVGGSQNLADFASGLNTTVTNLNDKKIPEIEANLPRWNF